MTWYDLYNFDDNKERVEKLLKKFDIKKYHFVTIQGETALIITKNLNNYIIEVLNEDEEMVISKKKYTRLGQRHKKEYTEIVKSFKNDCLFNAIEWVSKDNLF